jgi:hypothetical protein
MSFSLQTNWELITQNKEKRISENLFTLALEGYQIFPIDKKMDAKKETEKNTFGKVKIKKITWENEETIVVYELISLHSPN